MLDSITNRSSSSVNQKAGPVERSPFLAALSMLADAGLQPCLMRADPNPVTWHDELDLIISPRKLPATLKVLRKAGWEILDTGLFEPSRRHLLFWSNGRFLKIDLYVKIVSGCLEYIDGDDYIAGASLREFAFTPTLAKWLFHVAVNTVLEKRSLPEYYRPRLESALQNYANFDEARELATRAGVDFLFDNDRSLDYLFDETAIAVFRPLVRAALLRARFANRVRVAWQRFIYTAGQRAGLRSGFSIAAVGPDGSGKSTFLETMQAVLNRNGIGTQTVYFGPWERCKLPTSKALRRIGAGPGDYRKSSPYRKSNYRLFKGYIKRCLYYANFLPEMWARYAIGALRAILRRRVVLFDRHPIDLLAGLYNEPIENMWWLRILLVRLSPRPSMLVFLDNDAQVIWSRKKEFPLFLIERSLKQYRILSQQFGMISIRTDHPADELVNMFFEYHWRRMVRLLRDGFPFKHFR